MWDFLAYVGGAPTAWMVLFAIGVCVGLTAVGLLIMYVGCYIAYCVRWLAALLGGMHDDD